MFGLCGWFDRRDVSYFVDECAKDFWAVGMVFAKGFSGITQTGITGTDKEGNHHVGIGIGLTIEH